MWNLNYSLQHELKFQNISELYSLELIPAKPIILSCRFLLNHLLARRMGSVSRRCVPVELFGSIYFKNQFTKYSLAFTSSEDPHMFSKGLFLKHLYTPGHSYAVKTTISNIYESLRLIKHPKAHQRSIMKKHFILKHIRGYQMRWPNRNIYKDNWVGWKYVLHVWM